MVLSLRAIWHRTGPADPNTPEGPQPALPTGSADTGCRFGNVWGRSSGFMLLDMVLALTILLLLVAIIWPTFGTGTTTLRESATALDIATLLRGDRTLAAITGLPTQTRIDLDNRTFISARGRTVQVPADVIIEVGAGRACMTSRHRFVIVFAPDGTSCGGTVTLKKGGASYVVRFNWLTGMIDVVYAARS